ncbi:MAG: OmpA family protein [Bacteroidales bacterium]|nr:OmpA family protein [Bacteroidales bacterium]
MKKFIFILLIFSCGQLLSQNLSTKNKKAIEYFNKAYSYYNAYNYEKAIYWSEQAISKDKNFIEVYYLLSDIYDETKRPAYKILTLKKAIAINPQKSSMAYFTLAKTELSIGKYEDAKRHLLELKKHDTSGRYAPQTKNYIKRCDFGINAIKNPVNFKPVNLGKNINSEYNEYLPAITADEQTLIYTRLIGSGKRYDDGTLEMQEDFFISEKENNTFKKATALGEPLNTIGNEGAQSISADGKTLFFTSCEYESGKSYHGKTYGSCDIFVSHKTGDNWSQPENLGAVVNSKYWESQPSFSADGKTLYFASNRPGGKGKIDIWKTELQEDNTWTKPVNLGNSINTKGHDQSPFIHYDNKTLYFASNGHLGLGKQDLFLSRKDSSGNFGKAKNLGYPINTFDEEVSLTINAKGNKAYYASSKKSKFGGLDLYTFELTPENQPHKVTYIKGIVYNAESVEKLDANIKLINLSNNSTVAQSISDKETGEFLICIPAGQDYAFNVSKEGYLFYSESFSLTKSSDSLKVYRFDIPLSPIRKGKKTILKNIFFEVDSYKLEEKSLSELEKLYSFLQTNQKLRAEISGHTDNTGNETHNKQLSLNRAKAVYDYLISKGISENRIIYKGYGSLLPIDTNNTEKGRKNNRRTEFKII